MHYANIKKTDISNGPGVRVSLFVSGCRNQCPGCFNEVTWDFDYGTPYTGDTTNEIMEALGASYVNGLSILGGEPLEPENQLPVHSLINRVRQTYPEKDIWLYTGFTYEEIFDTRCRAHTPIIEALVMDVDVLVEGRFDASKADVGLKFRGSTNQRIIDIKKTLSSGVITIWEN